MGKSSLIGVALAAGALWVVAGRRKEPEPAPPSAAPSDPAPRPAAAPRAPAPPPVQTPPAAPEGRLNRRARLLRNRELLLTTRMPWVRDPDTGERFTLEGIDRELATLPGPPTPQAALSRLRTQRALLESTGQPFVRDRQTNETLTLAEVNRRIARLEALVDGKPTPQPAPPQRKEAPHAQPKPR